MSGVSTDGVRRKPLGRGASPPIPQYRNRKVPKWHPATEGGVHTLNPGTSAHMVVKVEPSRVPGVLGKRYFLVGAGLRIVVAKGWYVPCSQGLNIMCFPQTGRSTEVAVAFVLRMADEVCDLLWLKSESRAAKLTG
eukprot:1161325-Pelagomonas_calceolata.AAC.5